MLVSVLASVSISVSGGVRGATPATANDEAEERILSSQASTVTVRVIETDEYSRAKVRVGRRMYILLS